MPLREIEITNFKGMNRSVKPSLQEADTILNLDPRGRDGELTNTPAFVKIYDPPTYSGVTTNQYDHLGIKTFFMSQFDKDDQREVTLLVQKGTVAPIANSGNTAKSILLFSVRPYWNGFNWVDDWEWLNETILTDITAANGADVSFRDVAISDKKYGWRIENLTKNEFAAIIEWDVLTGYTITKTGWSVGDKVILSKNYVPMQYLEGMYSAVVSEMAFHNVLNDLRFACGAYENRLGLSIGYRARTWDIVGLTRDAKTINGLVLDPYFPIDDDRDIYDIECEIEVGYGEFEGANEVNFFFTEFQGTKLFETFYFKLTAVTDNYNEFYVASKSMVAPEDPDLYEPDIGASQKLYPRVTPKIDFARMNKRITKFNLYVAPGNNTGETGEYLLAKSYDLSDFSEHITEHIETGTYWSEDIQEKIIIDSDGFLKFYESYKIQFTSEVRESPAQVYYVGYKNNGGEFKTKLGYEPTFNYVKSWDKGVLVQNRTHLLNGYINERNENIIFISPFGGNSAPQYDVLTTDAFYNLESRDGNNILGLEVLPNMDLLAIKQTSKQAIDTVSGSVRDLVRGKGTIAKRSIVNFGDRLCWANKYGILASDGINDSDITKTIRELYESITDKEDIIAAMEEKDNAYRFNATFQGGVYKSSMLLINNFGWLISKLDDTFSTIVAYDTNKDGLICSLDHLGKIYKIDFDTIPGIISNPTPFLWQSVPLDVSLLGAEIKDNSRILLNRVWVDYEFSEDCLLKYRIDGGTWQGKTISASNKHYSWQIEPGTIGRIIEIAVSGSYHSGWANKPRLKAIGLLFDISIQGRFG